MASEQRFRAALELVDRLYAAALDEAAWPELTADMVTLVGGAGVLFMADLEEGTADAHPFGFSDNVKAAYTQKFGGVRDEYRRRVLGLPPGSAFTVDTVMSRSEFRRTAVYNEWYRPNGFERTLGAVSVASPSHSGGLAVFRGTRDPDFTEEDLRLAGQLARHVGRVHGLRQQFLTATVASGPAVLVINRYRRVTFADEAAEAILRRGDPLLLRHGRLACRDPNVDRRLAGCLARIAADPRAAEPAVLDLPGEGRGRGQLRLTPFPPSAAWPFSFGGEVLLSIERERALPQPGNLRARLGLTHMEARVALAVAESGGLAAAAARLGLSRNTVHTHLQRVYDKTDVHRQADLVRLLLAP